MLQVRVDSVPLERRDVAVVVLEPQLLDGADLAGKVMEPVVQAVRQRGIGEAAVSPRSALGYGIGLEERDVAVGVRLLGVDRGPQPGEAAADDQQVRALVSRQGRARLAIQLVEPEAPRLGVGQCEDVGIDGKAPFAVKPPKLAPESLAPESRRSTARVEK